MGRSGHARRRTVAALTPPVIGLLVLAACATTSASLPQTVQDPPLVVASTTTPSADPTRVPPTPRPTLQAEAPILNALGFSRVGWRTDFNRATVPLSEIRSGGPPRDGIPPLDRPAFVEPSAATWLAENEPVVVYEENGDARAYPLQILIWHEIVNDTVGGRPVTITFCPLCNTAIAFDRRLDGVTYDFGTTGNLRRSDLVMWDRQTESWWQQVTGEAIVGDLAGARLIQVPASIQSFASFRAAFPTGLVLSRTTGFTRDYGRNPYVGYDDVASSPFLYDGPKDGRLAPMERVVTVALGDEAVAYPFTAVAQAGVVHDIVGGSRIVIFHRAGTSSALDGAQIAGSRDIGAAGVFDPHLDGQALSLHVEHGEIRDRETGSRWDILGRATAGPRAGRRLLPLVHANHFWFAMAAFYPDVRVWRP